MHQWPLIRRWIPSVKKRFAALTWTKGFRVYSAEGLLFLLDYRNYVDRQVYLYGGYERDRLAFLLEKMRSMNCQVFMDIGANFGLYSLIVADRLKTPQIHAFEPDPRNYDQLRANLFLNRLSSSISTYQFAISDITEKVTLSLSEDTSTGKTKVVEGEEGYPVDAIRLDDQYDFTDNKVAIKIDIEGHELQALHGMHGLLTNNQCLIQVESFSDNLGATVSLMRDYGYNLIHQIEDDCFFTNIQTS